MRLVLLAAALAASVSGSAIAAPKIDYSWADYMVNHGYVVYVIAAEDDTWSVPEDREGLMRDLTNAPLKKSVLIPHATHFVLFEK